MNKKFLIKSISIAIMLGILYILINGTTKSIVIFNNSVIYIIAFFISIVVLNYYMDTDHFNLNQTHQTILYNIIDYAHIILITSFVIQLCFLYILFPATVTKTSMNPNLYEGEKVVVIHNKDAYKRFDIVIFKVDNDLLNDVLASENDELWIKRVIGLPGEKVEYKYGKLYINDELVREEYLIGYDGYFHDGYYDDENGRNYYNSYTNDFSIKEILDLMNLEGGVIPEGYYLLLGDNRSYSKDSRQIGLVHESLIIGRARYLINNIFNWEKLN